MLRSPGMALGWQIYATNRRGLVGLAAAVVLSALVLNSPWRDLLPPQAMLVVGLLSVIAFIYLFSAISLSELKLLDAMLVQRFPARMFALPVTTWRLVSWPMFYGLMAVIVLWVVISRWVLLPVDINIPVVAPALALAASALAFQSMVWIAFPSVWIRVALSPLLASLPLASLLATTILEWTVFAQCAVLIAEGAAIYGLALWGVAADRCGARFNVPSTGIVSERFVSLKRHTFRSKRQAQAWMDWRSKGKMMPLSLVVAQVLFITLAWFVSLVGEPPVVVLILMLVTPLWFVLLVGGSIAKRSFWGTEYAMAPFNATRAMSSGDIAEGLMITCMRCLATMALIVAVSWPVAIAVIGPEYWFARLWEVAISTFDGAVLALVCSLVIGAVLASGFVTGNLTLGLTGRMWVSSGTMSAKWIGYVALFIWLDVDSFPQFVAKVQAWSADEALVADVNRILFALIVVKFGLAAVAVFVGVVYAQMRRRFWLLVALVWVVGVMAGLLLIDTVKLLESTPQLATFAALCLVIAVPLAQPLAAPIATWWNRHR